MAFADALTDVCTIYSPDLSQESTGEQVVGKTAVYEDEPCRMMKGGYGVPRSAQVTGQFEDPRDGWSMLLNPSVTGVGKRYRVLCNGLDLVVTGVHAIKGDTQDVHHVVLFLQEKS